MIPRGEIVKHFRTESSETRSPSLVERDLIFADSENPDQIALGQRPSAAAIGSRALSDRAVARPADGQTKRRNIRMPPGGRAAIAGLPTSCLIDAFSRLRSAGGLS